ncbi:MAG TPA: FAD-dependent oxidoreductase [Spirochaetia bacterium]|nr:FAD-dependent oxidoreductase [Spirochaetia bacterium]
MHTHDLPHRLPVRRNEQILPGVQYLEIDRPFEFAAGQCVSLSTLSGPARYYSIASGERAPSIGILYDVVPGGALTKQLSLLVPGDTIMVSDPFGTFVDDRQPSMWIATGTGVAPFLSAIRSGSVSEKTLVYGSRTSDRFYFADELSTSLGDRLVLCCSQCAESPGTGAPAGSGEPWGGARRATCYSGRLTGWLRDAASTGKLPIDTRYFLCGSAGMIVDVRDLLIASGVAFDRIHSEIYF